MVLSESHMEEKEFRFSALKRLKSRLREAQSFDELKALAVAFAEDHLAAVSVKILRTPSALSPADRQPSPSVAQFPIGRSGYWLQVTSSQPFSNDDQALLEIASHLLSTASAFPNAEERSPRQTEQQLAELDALYQASTAMTAELDVASVLESVVSEITRLLPVESCSLFLWETNRRRPRLVAHRSAFNRRVDGEAAVSTAIERGGISRLSDHQLLQRLCETPEIVRLRLDDEDISSFEADALQAAGLQSALFLPLVRNESVLGLLGLGQVSRPRTFTDREIRLVQNLVSMAAVAIEHARLFGQAQRRVEELSALQEIVLQLNTPLELNAVLDTITESALRLIGATNLHIYLYNEATDVFTFGSALWRSGRRTPAVEAPRFNGLTSTVVHKAAPVVINDASTHELYQSEEAQAFGISAIAGFPLKYGDQVIGAFTATYIEPHVFTEDELMLLGLLADQAAVAVRNAGLFAGSQRRLRDMAALVDMAKQVTGNLKLDDVLQTTVQILQGLLAARASTITMLSEDGTELVVAAAVGVEPAYHNARMKLGDSISGEVVRKGELVYVNDARSDPDFFFFDEVIRSLLAVPLVIRGEIIGTMTVDSASPNAFSDSDVQLMTIAAAQVSIAIANARFIEELEARAAELAVAYEELKESDRLKDELVQNLSHELRTPLTFVKGYVDLLLEGEMGEISSDQEDALQIIAGKTIDITRLIEDIITLQRINAGNLQLADISLTELIDTAIAGHGLVADKKGIKFKLLLPIGQTIIEADKARINQVLDNIIGNAIKFSPDGGTIVIELQEDEDFVQLSITDQGIGVPKDKLERIFDRFYQVDGSVRRRFGGTGVGLAIVKRIIDAHQGQIWVESELGAGSSFFVRLPKIASRMLE